MRTENYLCDVCGKEVEKFINLYIQIIFTTEQTEGRCCEPYLSREEIDLCNACMNIVLEGNYIFASGAQGYNRYWFKGVKNDS